MSATVPPLSYPIGVLSGEGVGPDVVACALEVLEAVAAAFGRRFEVLHGGAVGRVAERQCGQPLSSEVCEFCERVWERGGAVLAGAAGGRFVYDIRRRFDLFYKLSPVKVTPALADCGPMRAQTVQGVDFVVVREIASGIYQGQWSERMDNGRVAEHSFSYREDEVRRVVEVGARLALERRGVMKVVYKDSGLPTVSALWRDVALKVAGRLGVECSMIDVDYASCWMLQYPREADVIVTSNLMGDILSDLGALLLGSRGLIYSGNFNAAGHAIYQTNHGAAYDLAGLDRANPVAQIQSLAFMLARSFGLRAEAAAIHEAIEEVWRQGWRTADLAVDGCRVIGTRDLGRRVAAAVSCSPVAARA